MNSGLAGKIWMTEPEVVTTEGTAGRTARELPDTAIIEGLTDDSPVGRGMSSCAGSAPEVISIG